MANARGCQGCRARPCLSPFLPLPLLCVLAGVLRGARFCEYSGKWYCRQCHLNQRSVVPARILQAWDFGQYRVSVRAKDFIETIWDEAVFDVEVFNDALYSKVKALAEMRVRVLPRAVVLGAAPVSNRSLANLDLARLFDLCALQILRTQLSYVRDFLQTCRQSERSVRPRVGRSCAAPDLAWVA